MKKTIFTILGGILFVALFIFVIESAESESEGYYEEEYEEDYSSSNDDYSSSSTSSSYTPTETATYTKPLTLEETSCSKDGNYISAKGYVKNQSDETLSFIQIDADFLDGVGNIVDTDYTYAVGAEGLAPNSRKSFEVMSPFNESMEKCNSKIVNYQ